MPTPPVNTLPPDISGTPQVGQTLNATTGNWSGTQPITYAFQWRRCGASGGNCTDVAGATLYLSGTLSSASALHVMRLCDRLPTAIRTLRVDLRTATVLDSSALDALGVGLRRWRHARGGMTRVVARHRTAVGAAR